MDSAVSLLDMGAVDVIKLALSYIYAKNVIFIIMLIVVGMFLKSIEKLDNQYIRIILAILGILVLIVKDGPNMDSMIQGVFVAGAAVLLYDIKHSVFTSKRKERV